MEDVKAKAILEYEMLFEEKTGIKWSEKLSNNPIKNRYSYLPIVNILILNKKFMNLWMIL